MTYTFTFKQLTVEQENKFNEIIKADKHITELVVIGG